MATQKLRNKQNLLTYFFLVGLCVVISLQSCNCINNGTSGDPLQDHVIPTPDLIPIPTGPNIRQENVLIDDKDDWLDTLGIVRGDDNTMVVNSTNKPLEGGGGGIDGALIDWVAAQKTDQKAQIPWKCNTLMAIRKGVPVLFSPRPVDSASITIVNTGEFVFIGVDRLGFITLAVGPKASEVTTLAETSKMIEDLYYQILKLARNPRVGCKKIVLCAISTGHAAGDGKESNTGKSFTKEQFIRYVYNGMHAAINKFTATYPNSEVEIILNNWHPS
jgi:O-acetyl-ADP-ribose deacetylase (regulator of RNase III)